MALRLSLGEPRETAKVTNIETVILNVLANRPMTQPEIDDAVQAKTLVKRKALRELVQQGSITRSGSGVRGDPFMYQVACFPVPAPIDNSENKKPLEGVSEDDKILVPNIPFIHTEQENKKQESLLNVEEKLVPTKMDNDANPAMPGISNPGWWGTAEGLPQAGYGYPLDTPCGVKPGPDGTWHLAFTKMEMHGTVPEHNAKERAT